VSFAIEIASSSFSKGIIDNTGPKISAKKIENEFVSMASMNSWIYADDIGKMCAFLISDEAERISGQIIGVDGNATRLD